MTTKLPCRTHCFSCYNLVKENKNLEHSDAHHISWCRSKNDPFPRLVFSHIPCVRAKNKNLSSRHKNDNTIGSLLLLEAVSRGTLTVSLAELQICPKYGVTGWEELGRQGEKACYCGTINVSGWLPSPLLGCHTDRSPREHWYTWPSMRHSVCQAQAALLWWSRGLGLTDRAEAQEQHTGVCRGTAELLLGRKERTNCQRNSIFNKLLRGTPCLFKSESCKQWKQKGSVSKVRTAVEFPGSAGKESCLASEYGAGSSLDVVSTPLASFRAMTICQRPPSHGRHEVAL